jgi:hypothetical protein
MGAEPTGLLEAKHCVGMGGDCKVWLLPGPSGNSRNRSSDRQVDAERFMIELASQLRGSYVDLRAGRTPFADYASGWLERKRGRSFNVPRERSANSDSPSNVPVEPNRATPPARCN